MVISMSAEYPNRQYVVDFVATVLLIAFLTILRVIIVENLTIIVVIIVIVQLLSNTNF